MKFAYILLAAILWVGLVIFGSAIGWWFGRLCANLIGIA